MALDEASLAVEFDEMVASLMDRHRDVEAGLIRRYHEIQEEVPQAAHASHEQRLVIGAYFSAEYSFEAAALFNPSMVRHPDQREIEPGQVRFLLSLRGIGEGHLSSVTFRSGVWCPRDGFFVDAPSKTGCLPRIEQTDMTGDDQATHIVCESSRDYSESVLFPVTASQTQGIEDLRLVWFTDDDGSAALFGTYTAFNGREARSEILKATGFKTFDMRPLEGSVAAAKGMALFPRRLNGRYMMLGRQDNENIWLIDSDDLHRWEGGSILVAPRYPWEFIQVGNCGSPIEIDEGWLVLTHGVGMTRNYSIGACLLDKDNPSRLLARTSAPILRPSPDERDGYVPNVVYGCGAVVHGRTLLLPYGVADNFSAFATAPIDTILAAMD